MVVVVVVVVVSSLFLRRWRFGAFLREMTAGNGVDDVIDAIGTRCQLSDTYNSKKSC